VLDPRIPEWVRSLRDECQVSRTAFSLQAMGHWAPTLPRGVSAKQQVELRKDGRERSVLYAIGKKSRPVDFSTERRGIKYPGKQQSTSTIRQRMLCHALRTNGTHKSLRRSKSSSVAKLEVLRAYLLEYFQTLVAPTAR